MKELARNLRKHQTDAEKLLWSRLRNRQMEGCKFRRQQVSGPYIADFLCLEPKLIVELDGGQHLEQKEQDEQRTSYLQYLGYQVLRFWNNDVLQNLDGVLESIRNAICYLNPLTPTLSRREREQRASRFNEDSFMLLDVVNVKATPDYTLLLEFENGEKRVFDMSPYLDKGVFRQPRDTRLFSAARVDYGTVVWPGEIDMAPETLYDRSSPFSPAGGLAGTGEV